MPDILIRGMEMPPSCADCPIKGDSDCKLTRQKVKYYHEDRRDDCPIHELPPHGDLIDRDRLKHKFCTHCDGYEYDTNSCVDGDQDCMDARLIMNAPVVVPAERSDADA